MSNTMIIITALTGTLGFMIMYGIHPKRMPFVLFGVFLTTLTYVCFKDSYSTLVCNMFASIIATMYSEIMARVIKAPTTVFLIPAVVPLVPGGSLYYTMLNLIRNDSEKIGYYGNQALLCALGISVGIIICSIVAQIIIGTIYKLRHHRRKNEAQ